MNEPRWTRLIRAEDPPTSIHRMRSLGPRASQLDQAAGRAKLDHVEAVIVCLHEPGQRPALAQRHHVTSCGYRPEGHGADLRSDARHASLAPPEQKPTFR